MYFHFFVIISPWKRAGPFIWTNLNPLHPRMLVPSLVEIGPVVLEKKMKMWKVYRQTDGRTDGRTDRQTTDDRWSEKLRWAKKMKSLLSRLLTVQRKYCWLWKRRGYHVVSTFSEENCYYHPLEIMISFV